MYIYLNLSRIIWVMIYLKMNDTNQYCSQEKKYKKKIANVSNTFAWNECV